MSYALRVERKIYAACKYKKWKEEVTSNYGQKRRDYELRYMYTQKWREIKLCCMNAKKNTDG